MVGRRIIGGLVVTVVVLPMVVCVLLAIGGLLDAMADAAGAVVVQRIALSLGVVWIVSLILLLVAQAIVSLLRP